MGLRRYLWILIFWIGISATASAQFYPTQYRPPNQDWQLLDTPHFNIVYGANNDSSAVRMGRILEQQYPKIKKLVGGSLNNHPVVLNSYNDRSNGFVTPLHFRTEIELPPIKGKSMNPKSGSWLQQVGPHELTHAMQFSHLGSNNITSFVGMFSPDIARSFHGAIPSGITEGTAVYHETKGVTEYGGRGNYPYFTNQFDANFNSSGQWSMGQIVQNPTSTRPFNRHYIGGYTFTNWLQKNYGDDVTDEALSYYVDFPFLGYGFALHHATDLWPAQLYNRFEDDQQSKLQKNTSKQQQPSALNVEYEGASIHRPKWLSDSTLIFYGSFYNARPGFYSYNLETSELNRKVTTNVISDYQYALSDDKSNLIYSYYEADPLYDRTSKAELMRFNLENSNETQLTDEGRLYAPILAEQDLLALQTQPASSRLVSLSSQGQRQKDIDTLGTPDGYEIRSVAVNPQNDKWAVVARKNTTQALWISRRGQLSNDLQSAPDISFERGSVFDPAWHPNGNKLMFSSDFSGTFQLYEYDVQTEKAIQITRSYYNAYEGSYSSSGNRIAYVRQQVNERLPVVLHRAEFVSTVIDQSEYSADAISQKHLSSVVADSMMNQSASWESENYDPGVNWLKPRTVSPVIKEVSNQEKYQLGLGFHSNNLLASQAYSAEFSYFENRVWYDIKYQNKSFYPGFKLHLFSEPSYLFLSSKNGESLPVLQQERSLALSVPLQFKLNKNVSNTSLFIEPEIRQSQFRLFDLQSSNASSGFSNRTIGNIYGQFNYQLQQNIRDLQPNSGFLFYSELERYLSSDQLEFTIPYGDINFSLQQATALTGGMYTYWSPLRRWNQSLRIGLEAVTQSSPIFNNQSIVSEGFSEPVYPGAANLLSLSTRYTIPLAFVDDGGFLLPLYLNNIYLVAFSNTVTNPTAPNLQAGSRNIFGLGLRAHFQLSNLAFDIGIGLGYEPSRNNTQVFVGDF